MKGTQTVYRTMTYFDYLNTFNQWLEDNSPSDKVIVLYYAFLNMFNRRGWPETVRVDIIRLMSLARTSDKKTALNARKVLEEAGFIEYIPGQKGIVTQYKLLSGRDSYQKTKQENQPQTLLEPQPETTPLNNTIDKEKKDIYIPQNNSKANKSKEKDYLLLFDEFWTVYPRRVGKADAIKAWKKLKPDRLLLDTMIAAINKQQKTEQWQTEKFIPYPASWLNGRRWEDEIPNQKGVKKNDGYDDFRAI